MIRLTNLTINVNKIRNDEEEERLLRHLIIKKLKMPARDLLDYSIYKKSIDARKKPQIFYNYTLDISVTNEAALLNKHPNLKPSPDLSYKNVTKGSQLMANRPLIIGTGPAGLAAGLLLARNGYKPLILERGAAVEERSQSIRHFWQGGSLDPNTNVQFGEGGAGTFSDGKLTTLINDIRCQVILRELVAAGAPQEILYQHKPHIGTDRLKIIVKNIRNRIIAYGGEVRFNSLVTDFIIEKQEIKGVIINHAEPVKAEVVLLAIGHSARDTVQVLYEKGVKIHPKSFAIGLRIEHPQSLINRAQYGDNPHPNLGAAEYKLAYHSPNGRSAYTFCMCPGGQVVAAASEEGKLVTNGMSKSKRDGSNANAALLVGVNPADYGSDEPLAGIAFQRKYEKLAYSLGGANYRAPAQLTGDFLLGRASQGLGEVLPSYEPGITLTKLDNVLPDYVIATLREAIPYFAKRLRGFDRYDSILTGVETRTSAPIRITRDSKGVSNIKGLYPVGEGAGYAGGIMSSALDGIKAAEKVIQEYSN